MKSNIDQSFGFSLTWVIRSKYHLLIDAELTIFWTIEIGTVSLEKIIYLKFYIEKTLFSEE
jgi:hypothetical protein